MNKYLIVGAGGFIGGHLANRLLNDNNIVIGADIKPLELWFQKHDNSKVCRLMGRWRCLTLVSINQIM